MTSNKIESSAQNAQPSRGAEIFGFTALAFLIWPVVAVAIVGGYGFLVWMYQIVFGPPGPAGH